MLETHILASPTLNSFPSLPGLHFRKRGSLSAIWAGKIVCTSPKACPLLDKCETTLDVRREPAHLSPQMLA